jgi:hypothetical protein
MIDIPQAEADALLAMKKVEQHPKQHRYPNPGGKLQIDLIEENGKELFKLDISRGRVDLSKSTYQTRGRQTIILARLDWGAPHRNPDGEEVGVPHLHLYREGFGDKWAFPLPPEHFPNPTNPWSQLDDFIRMCNITRTLLIKRELFR